MKKIITSTVFITSMLIFPVYGFCYNNELSTAFNSGIMPILIDIGKIIFSCSVVYGAFYIMRKQYVVGVDSIKWAAIGYIALRLTQGFTSLVDNIASNLKF